MNIEWAKKQLELGIIEEEYVDFLKNEYLKAILDPKDPKEVNALVAYAGYLNSIGLNSDNYPLFLYVLFANNATAVDVLLDGYDPATFMEEVVPNHYIIESFFGFLKNYKKNEVYRRSLEVIVGYMVKVYNSVEEGYQLYQPSVSDVNALGKFLDEEQDQDEPLNRLILDVLLFFSDLDMPYETDENKLEIARQSSRIRSDYFDNTRSLVNSLTEVTLEKSDSVKFGIAPEYFYGKTPG